MPYFYFKTEVFGQPNKKTDEGIFKNQNIIMLGFNEAILFFF